MTSILNQQLFAEAFLRDLREVKSSVDIVDACRQTIREWRDEYGELDRPEELLPYLSYSFSALGFSYERRDDPAHFLLYSDDTYAQPIGVCLAVSDDLLSRTTKGQHHHARLIHMLRDRQLVWGILTNGSTWRLCHAKASAPYEEYLEADLDALLDPTHLPEFLMFYRFFNREAFDIEAGQNGHMPRQGLDRMLAESEKRTQVIERHLKNRVDDLLQMLCLGFVEDEAATSYNREQLDEIYRNAIYLLYRILFLFYAEARQLLPAQLPEYRPVSLASIIEDARGRQMDGVQNSDPHSLWKRLTRLFVVVDDGDASVGVQAYNGGLFSDTEKPYLLHHKMSDAYLAPALFDLGFVAGKSGPQPIDYRDLSVRHLGTLYEGMLEYRLNLVTDEPVVVRESGGKRVYLKQSASGPIKKGETVLGIGKVYFADDKGERKSSGSYYTPEDVVQYIVNNAVLPKLQELRATLDTTLEEALGEREIAATAEERDHIERYADQQILVLVNQSLLRLRILDPAMGSGHFLVAAGQMLTNFIVETLDATPWSNDTIDCAPLIWKRRVVERCLYGVDLNPLAMELAKLALWISSASMGKPLTFLDHHLRTGNSLYGTPLKRLAALPSAKQAKDDPMFDMLRETVITDILTNLADITSVDSDTIATVKQKGEAFKQAVGKATRLRDIANVWLASLFGPLRNDGKSLGDKEYAQYLFLLTQNHSVDAWESIVANDTTISTARKIAKEQKFFHWELEFADAVVDGRCQFHSIIANPPYVGTQANVAVKALFTTAKCNDLYGWFVEKALDTIDVSGRLGTIVPLSLMFSRQFKKVRAALISSNGKTCIAAFDATRDGIFLPNGESRNGQRAIILNHSKAQDDRHVYTTDLMRWIGEERPYLMSGLKYTDVTNLASEDWIPKIGNQKIVEFWERLRLAKNNIYNLSTSILGEGVKDTTSEWFLIVPRAVRYFLSAFPVRINRDKVLTLVFSSKYDRDLAAILINSNIHYWYWLAYGDGFATNADVVGRFPVPDLPRESVQKLADKLMNSLDECVTYQVKGEERIPNYNFNQRMDILLDIDALIAKHVAPDIYLPRDIFAQYKSNSFLRPLDVSALSEANEPETENV